jgi:4-amino-4-deoxy-L-arabinose transferase-like glycosyltransferase
VSPYLIISALTIVLLAPFLGKAFHIDDPMYLWTAQQIHKNPADFYGLVVNWFGYLDTMYLANQNPPLSSYFIALIALLFGWSETAIHMGFLLPAIAVSTGTYALAKYYSSSSLLAGLLAVVSPVFLVSASNVMTDIFMVALYTWAVYFWLKGTHENNWKYLFLSAMLMLLAALTKYFAISLIPLLFTYTLIKKHQLCRQLLFLLIPVFGLLLYQLYTQAMYDFSLITDATSYAFQIGHNENALSFAERTISGISYLGGCLFAAFFFFPYLWKRKAAVWLNGFLLIFATLTAFLAIQMQLSNMNWQGPPLASLILFLLFLFTGFQLMLMMITTVLQKPDAEAWLLFFWFWGTLGFAIYMNWTISARTYAPLIPVTAILIALQLQRTNDFNYPFSFNRLLPLMLAGAISLVVLHGDTTLANTQRAFATIIHEKLKSYPGKTWFQGHWGFQYYMEELGAMALDKQNPAFTTNDILIVPVNNTNVSLPDQKHFQLVELIELPLNTLSTTMSNQYLSGFYWGGHGPLPFSLGKPQPEKYLVFITGNFTDQQQAIAHYNKLITSSTTLKQP